MKLHECLEQVEEHDWFRPVGMKYEAFALRGDGSVIRVPSLKGGEPRFTNSVKDLKGEWEIVSAADVCTELDRAIENKGS